MLGSENSSAQSQPAQAGHARLMLKEIVTFFCTMLQLIFWLVPVITTGGNSRSCFHLWHFVLTWPVVRLGDGLGSVQQAKRAKKTRNDRALPRLVLFSYKPWARIIGSSCLIGPFYHGSHLRQPHIGIDGNSGLRLIFWHVVQACAYEYYYCSMRNA